MCVHCLCDWRCAVSNLRQVRDVYRVAAATRYSRREDASPSRFFPGNFPSETRPGLEVDHPVFLVSLSMHSSTSTLTLNRRGSSHGGISHRNPRRCLCPIVTLVEPRGRGCCNPSPRPRSSPPWGVRVALRLRDPSWTSFEVSLLQHHRGVPIEWEYGALRRHDPLVALQLPINRAFQHDQW